MANVGLLRKTHQMRFEERVQVQDKLYTVTASFYGGKKEYVLRVRWNDGVDAYIAFKGNENVYSVRIDVAGSCH